MVGKKVKALARKPELLKAAKAKLKIRALSRDYVHRLIEMIPREAQELGTFRLLLQLVRENGITDTPQLKAFLEQEMRATEAELQQHRFTQLEHRTRLSERLDLLRLMTELVERYVPS